MIVKELLPHQSAFIQAPYVFPEVRFHILLAGYGAGKTSSLVDATLKAIDHYSGKVDKEGKPPKILLCGITLTFLKKTFSGSLVAALRQTKSTYHYDKASNIIYVGGVEIYMTPIEDEESIFGYDVCIAEGSLVSTMRGDIPIEDITSDDYVLTRKGYKKVIRAWCSGEKEVLELSCGGRNLLLTPNHRVYTKESGFTRADELTGLHSLTILPYTEEKKWEDQRLSSSMVSGTTDTLTLRHTEKDSTTRAQQSTERWGSQHITETCGRSTEEAYQKGMTYTTETETTSTIESRTSNASQGLSTSEDITKGVQKSRKKDSAKSFTKLLKQVLLGQRQRKDKERFESDSRMSVRTERKEISRASSAVPCSAEHTQPMSCSAQGSAWSKTPITGSSSKEYAKCAEKNTPVTYTQAQRPALISAGLTKPPEPRGVRRVYDITVEDEPEFFANGILVHNCAAIVDELDELPTYKAVAVVKSLGDRCRQVIPGCRLPFLAFATTSQGLKGTYQLVQMFKRKGINYVLIRGRTKDNIHLPKEYVETQYKTYNEKEVRCLLDAEFISIDSGLVYPDYDPSKNRLEYSIYETVKPEETVYIGQDFNCLSGNGNLATDKGYIKLKDALVGTRVMTRKGYRKILTKKSNGSRIVVRCGKAWSTLDHVFITPKGDEERWKISNYYCLKKPYRLMFQRAQILSKAMVELQYSLKAVYGENKEIRGTSRIMEIMKQDCCTVRYTKNTTVKYLQEWLFTIKTVSLITVLKALRHLQEKNTSKRITQQPVSRNTGKKVSSKKKGLFAEYAERHLQEISKRLKCAEKNVSMLGNESEGISFTEQYLDQRVESVFGKRGGRTVQILLNPLRKLADAAALSLKENLNLFTALRVLKNVKELANGRVLYGVEREVFDIEVEDAHEFFVDGVLVHNCGFNKAVAAVVRDGVIYVVKEYSFPDIRRAPEVFRYDFPYNVIKWIPDATYNAHLPEFKKELRAAKINIMYRKTNPLVKDRSFLINKLFYAQRMFISSECKELDNALVIRQTDKNTGAPSKGKGENAPDHICDPLEYMSVYCTSWLRELKDLYKVTLGRRIEKRIEAGIEEEGDSAYMAEVDNSAFDSVKEL